MDGIDARVAEDVRRADEASAVVDATEWTRRELKELGYWKLVAIFLARGHARASERCAKRNVVFTSVIIILSVLLVFASASTDLKALIEHSIQGASFGTWTFPKSISASNIVIGFLGASTVAASMWQYNSRYEQRHLEHRQFQAEYFNLQKKISRLMVGPRDTNLIHALNKEMNGLNKFAPIVPAHIRRMKRSTTPRRWAFWNGRQSKEADDILETIIRHEEELPHRCCP